MRVWAHALLPTTWCLKWCGSEDVGKHADGSHPIMRSCVRGYHVYKDVWTATIGEELVCRRERGNAHDIYVVAVWKTMQL